MLADATRNKSRLTAVIESLGRGAGINDIPLLTDERDPSILRSKKYVFVLISCSLDNSAGVDI